MQHPECLSNVKEIRLKIKIYKHSPIRYFELVFDIFT